MSKKEYKIMCTVINYESGDYYFGRNLDLEYSYEETVTITPDDDLPYSTTFASTFIPLIVYSPSNRFLRFFFM